MVSKYYFIVVSLALFNVAIGFQLSSAPRNAEKNLRAVSDEFALESELEHHRHHHHGHHHHHPVPRPRPYYREYAKFARWLAHSADWGVMATSGDDNVKNNKDDLENFTGPFANVVDFADDIDGSPLFYLSPMDPTLRDLKDNPDASFVLSEASFSSCYPVSAEEPTCAKLTFSGELYELENVEEKGAALERLFFRHPSMAFWPANHDFKVMRMHIKSLFLIDFYGGAPELLVRDYLNAE